MAEGTEVPLAPGIVDVVGGAEGLEQEIRTGRHILVADEPADLGGSDRGPGPYDLLLAALGACKSMTLQMYARRKGWPLQGVRVRLRQARIHAEDCESCETKVGMVTRIECTIGLEGPLDEAQRRRLLEIADRCPVHRTLSAEIDIRTLPE